MPNDPFADFQASRIRLPDAGQLAYYIREGQGPCLVLIPGSWGDAGVFDHLIEGLSPRLRLVIVELRGHGGSQPPTLEASIKLFAEDVLRVVDYLELRRFYVGGHSIGGMIPLEIARRRPEAVAGVIAIEGWTHHDVQNNAFGHIEPGPLPDEKERERHANRARVLDRLSREEAQSFGAAWRNWDGLSILESTPVPVLEIWGDRGHPTPSRAVMRIPERPNIELVWLRDASHALLIERPAELAVAINGFIEKVEAGRSDDAQSREHNASHAKPGVHRAPG